MPNAAGVGKLKRSAMLTYIDASFGGQSPSWFLIGKNILDETVTEDNGYEPSFSADTYYANTNEPIYEKLKDIMMNRKTGEDCRTKVLEVLVDKTEGPFDAWQEDCVVKPQSYGGAQGGVRIPYNVYFDGNRQNGTAAITDRVPTFTAAS